MAQEKWPKEVLAQEGCSGFDGGMVVVVMVSWRAAMGDAEAKGRRKAAARAVVRVVVSILCDIMWVVFGFGGEVEVGG
jgi:hypothetical protein